MNKNNFFMIFGIATLLATHLELYSSENTRGIPYVVGAVVVGTTVLMATQTNTFQTYNNHTKRLAQEKEECNNQLVHAEPLSSLHSDTSAMSNKAQVFLQQYEDQRRAEAQKCATKKIEQTLSSHIIDDYAGEDRK